MSAEYEDLGWQGNRKSLKLGRRIVDMRKGTVPDEVIEDRDKRAKLSHRTLTQSFFGDPLPGYSELDKRK